MKILMLLAVIVSIPACKTFGSDSSSSSKKAAAAAYMSCAAIPTGTIMKRKFIQTGM